MSSTFYQKQQLATVLEAFQAKQNYGVLYLDAEINLQATKRSRVLVLHNGKIVYGDIILPTNREFAKILGKQLNREWSESAIALATQKATNKTSTRALLDLLIKMRLFTWEQVETFVHKQVVLTLEQLLPHAGYYRLDNSLEFDLCHGKDCHGLDLAKLIADVNYRQQQLSAFAPAIPSIEAIPYFNPSAADKITNPAVRKHLEQWVNGKRSLIDIAEGLNKDVMQVMQSYLPWVKAGWVLINNNNNLPIPKKELPIILAVDDSPIMQVTLKRALSEQYQVLIASNAKDALMLLHRTDVELLLLDVTMPEIDGLEVCRTVRSIAKFRDLPIIMVTAKDGFFDKVKGKFAGSTDYVTKPFNPEQLRQLVSKYINSTNNSDSLSTI
ncbi:response regulator [Synechocystis sp. PCC 7509]|uniref:response regulator n=1 Tax=Synechocystis sp. PCC 7509 TaxID=927677 RepID=UPI0002AC02BA|nr:response regulator [Synechocystis sp. PCC 7509]